MKLKFGFLDEYLGGNKDKDNKQLIPTRKPSVRLNLKGVRVNRKKTIPKETSTESIIDAENTVDIKDINSNEIVVTKQKPQENPKTEQKKGFRFADNFNFFTKSKLDGFGNNKNNEKLDEGYLRRELSKKPKRFGLWFLIISVFLLVVISIYVFYTATVNASNESLNECKNTVSKALNKGIRTDDLNCGGFNVFDFGKSGIARYEEIDKKISIRELESQAEIETLDSEIEKKSELLSIFGENYESQDLMDKNYLTLISKKQEEIAQLDSKLADKKSTIAEFEKNYDYLVSLAGDAPIQEELDFYNQFTGLDDDNKFENFELFKQSFASLQEKLQFQISSENPYAGQAFSDPEFFNYKIFEPSEFISVFDNKNLINTVDTLDRLSITGDVGADNKIYGIAESRGYKIRVSAVEDKLVAVGTERVQKEVSDSFAQLREAALAEGIDIQLVSGYRSISDQKEIFSQRFASQSIADTGSEYTAIDLISGVGDDSINEVLKQSSVPGYSKHHSGYTIDINQVDGSGGLTAFGETEAFKWISANNYYNAKRFGFVPSYPEGGGNVGPEPEPWEYVWVGVDLLRN